MALTFAEVRSICLWRSLTSRYLIWKLRQNPPRRYRASGRPAASAAWSRPENTRLSSGGSDHSPISAYEAVGTYTRPIGGFRSSQSDGVVVVSQAAFASSASKNRSTQRLPPQQCSQVVGHVPERDPVAEALLGPEDGQDAALVVGRVRAPELFLRDRGRPEVVVVQDRPAVAALDQRSGQVRLPDPLREPGAAGPAAGDPLDLVGHLAQLANPVALRERGQDGLVVAAPEELHLAAPDDLGQALDELRSFVAEPVQERARVVEGEADARVAVQRVEHGPVRRVVDVAEDPSEIAHRLVVVQRECQRDPRRHESSCACRSDPPTIGGLNGPPIVGGSDRQAQE